MKYDSLVPEVLPDVLGCPDPTIERALRDAAVDLCVRGFVWQVVQGADNLGAGADIIDLEVPSRARLVSVLSVKAGARELTAMTREDLDAVAGDWRTATGLWGYTWESDTELRLVGVPDAATTNVWVRFVVAPTLASTEIPDHVAERWYQPIVAGAKSRLMLMNGTSWWNPDLAAVHLSTFMRGMREARLFAAQDGVNAQRSIIAPHTAQI